MSSFTDPLIVKHINGKSWKLCKSFKYCAGDESSEEVICVPKGFITDFASIPRLFWTIIGHPTGKYGKAAVIHDYCYFRQLYSRKRSDEIFYEAMQVLKVPFIKRWLMYHAVRTFGWIPWGKYRRKK